MRSRECTHYGWLYDSRRSAAYKHPDRFPTEIRDGRAHVGPRECERSPSGSLHTEGWHPSHPSAPTASTPGATGRRRRVICTRLRTPVPAVPPRSQWAAAPGGAGAWGCPRSAKRPRGAFGLRSGVGVVREIAREIDATLPGLSARAQGRRALGTRGADTRPCGPWRARGRGGPENVRGRSELGGRPA